MDKPQRLKRRRGASAVGWGSLGWMVVLGWVSGCATPSYVTHHGLVVFDHTRGRITQSNVEAVTQEALGAFAGAEALRDVEVHFYAKLIVIPGPNDTAVVADGYADPGSGVVLVSAFSDCVAASSLAHELAHIIRDAADQPPDPGHTDIAFWSRVEALEARLEDERCTPEALHLEALARRSPDAPTEEEDDTELGRPVPGLLPSPDAIVGHVPDGPRAR